MARDTTRLFRERWLSAVLAHPGPALGAVAILTLVLGSGLLHLDLRTDGAAINPLDNTTIERTLADRETFLDGEQAIVLLSSRPGGPLLESEA